MTIGSLFSGIGGLELGLEWAGFGETIWQVEIDPFRRDVLATHWPYARRFDDVRHCARAGGWCGTTAPKRPDFICGGFPCQPFSPASRGRRTCDLSLWREFARIIGALQPAGVVVENVANNAAKHWLPAVRRDLHVLGYRTRALRIDARDVGAPHARARIFVVGYPDTEAQSARAIDGQVAGVPTFAGALRHWRQPFAGPVRMADGLPEGVDRLESLGDAVVPQAAYVAGLVLRDGLARNTDRTVAAE